MAACKSLALEAGLGYQNKKHVSFTAPSLLPSSYNRQIVHTIPEIQV